MTLVFRIPISDAQAYAIVRALRPGAIAAVGQKRPSHRRVRAIVAPLLRARCEEQIAKWTVHRSPSALPASESRVHPGVAPSRTGFGAA